MKGVGTNDEALIRVVTTRAEIDMYYIKQEFQATYKKSLESFIAGDTSGNYKFFLLSLVGGAWFSQKGANSTSPSQGLWAFF